MRNYKAIFLMEGRRFLSSRNFKLIFLVYLAILLLLHSNIVDYRDTIARGRNFQAISNLKFEKMMNYNNYSLIGIKSLFIPSPLSVLYNSIGPAYDWKGRVDTIATLDIDKNAKGNAAFQEEAPFSPFRHPYIILIAGGLLTLLYGFGALRNIEYTRFLSSYLRPGHIFAGIIIARVVFITLCLAILSALVLILFHLEGIHLTPLDIEAFFSFTVAGWALLLFFFSLGLMIGWIRSTFHAWTIMLSGWFVLVLLLPAAVTAVVNKKAAKITESGKVELEQLKIIVDFEKRVENEIGKFNRKRSDEFRIKAESYWNNDYKLLEKIENSLKNEVALQMDSYHNFCKWTPITFYLSAGKYVGGKGPDNYLGYYDFLINLKRNFLRFFIDRCFYHNPLEMVNFIKADENLFYARSQMPSHFGTGLLITFLYIALFLAISFFQFNKSLYRLDKRAVAGRESTDIRLADHEVNTYFVLGEDFRDFLYALLSGQRSVIRKTCFTGSVWIDETDLMTHEQKKNQPNTITYIPRPRDLPGDIDAPGLVALVCRLVKLPPEEKKLLLYSALVKSTENSPFKELDLPQIFQVMLLLAPLNKSRYYLFNDVAAGLTLDYGGQLMDLMEKLNTSGSIAIFLTASASILEEPIEKCCWYGEGGAWTYRVKAFLHAQKTGKKR